MLGLMNSRAAISRFVYSWVARREICVYLTLVVATSVLFARLGSSSLADTSAVFVIDPAVAGATTIRTMARLLFARAPRSQETVPPA